MAFRVRGLKFRGLSLGVGFRVWDLGFMVWGLGFRCRAGFRVWGSGFRLV